jgi:histidine triad (HIT) family protein
MAAPADCLFCRIIAGAVPAKRVDLGDPDLERDLFAFEDIRAQAPHHVLIIPRQHLPTLNDLRPEHAELMGKLFLAARHVAAARGLAGPGYRVVVNCNAGAGQSVFHIHLHLLGGRPLHWPPG